MIQNIATDFAYPELHHLIKSLKLKHLQHAISHCRQPLEKTNTTGWQLVPEPGWPQKVQSPNRHHPPDGHQVKPKSSKETNHHKQEGRPRVSPAQQRLEPLPLSRHVTNHRLDPPRHTPQPVIPNPHNLRASACWKRVKLLI